MHTQTINMQINNIIINVSNELTSDDIGSHVLNIYIGFYHPELTTRYGIQVICPINYVSPGRDPDASIIS